MSLTPEQLFQQALHDHAASLVTVPDGVALGSRLLEQLLGREAHDATPKCRCSAAIAREVCVRTEPMEIPRVAAISDSVCPS